MSKIKEEDVIEQPDCNSFGHYDPDPESPYSDPGEWWKMQDKDDEWIKEQEKRLEKDRPPF